MPTELCLFKACAGLVFVRAVAPKVYLWPTTIRAPDSAFRSLNLASVLPRLHCSRNSSEASSFLRSLDPSKGHLRGSSQASPAWMLAVRENEGLGITRPPEGPRHPAWHQRLTATCLEGRLKRGPARCPHTHGLFSEGNFQSNLRSVRTGQGGVWEASPRVRPMKRLALKMVFKGLAGGSGRLQGERTKAPSRPEAPPEPPPPGAPTMRPALRQGVRRRRTPTARAASHEDEWALRRWALPCESAAERARCSCHKIEPRLVEQHVYG